MSETTSRKQTILDRYLWSIYSRTYDGLLHFWPYTHLLDLMQTAIGSVDGLKLLDLGCGTGNLLRILSSRGGQFSAIGVDFSPAMLRVAQKKLEPYSLNVKLVTSDIIDFLSRQPSASFDKIISVNVIYAVNDQEALWREMLRVLKPKGEIVATTSVRPGSGPIILEHIRHSGFTSLLRPRLIGIFITDALINILGRTGKYSFTNEAQLRRHIAQTGAVWHETTRCYGGEENGVNILFRITH